MRRRTTAVAVNELSCCLRRSAVHSLEELVSRGHEEVSPSQSRFRKWLPVARRAAALASISESPRQSVDQIRRRGWPTGPTPQNTKTKQKTRRDSQQTARLSRGASKRQNGFGRFSRICIALCNLTGKQRCRALYFTGSKKFVNTLTQENPQEGLFWGAVATQSRQGRSKHWVRTLQA